MKTRHKSAVWGVAVAVAATLPVSGCFGGSDDNNAGSPPAVTAEVPATASQSIAGFIVYLQELVVASADTLEPVDTSMVTASTDETSEPTKVD